MHMHLPHHCDRTPLTPPLCVQPSGDKAGEGVPLGSSSSIHVTEGGARGNHGNREEAPDKPWTLLDVLTSPTEREYFKVGGAMSSVLHRSGAL